MRSVATALWWNTTFFLLFGVRAWTSDWITMKSLLILSREKPFFFFFFIQRPRSGVHISWNTPVSLAKSNQSLQFRNANPETPWCMIWSLFHSVDTPQGDLHHSCVTTSRLTYFILQAHAGTGISHREKQNNSGEVKKTIQVNDPGRQILARNKSLAVGVTCMTICWPTLGFEGRTFKLCVLNRCF